MPEPGTELHEHDFVAGQSNGRTIEGEVIQTPPSGKGIYLVQVYDDHGPTDTIAQATHDQLYPHPVGRASVVEHISDGRQKMR